MTPTPSHPSARRLWPLAVALGLAATAARAAPPPGGDLPSPLTLERALDLLDERGLDLLVAEAAVRSAEGDVAVARAIPNPQLSASLGKSFTYGDCHDATGAPASCGVLPTPQLGIGISDSGALFDGLSGKRGLRRAVARAALDAARLSRDDARRTLRAAVKTGFLQVVVAQESTRIAREVATASARTEDLTRERWKAGAIGEADLARTEVARLEADQAVDSADAALRDARAALAFLLGVRAAAPELVAEGADLVAARPLPAGAQALDALLAAARARRPDLLAAERQRARAEAALALARRQRLPDVTLSLNYAQQGAGSDAVTPPTVTAGVALPLPIFYRQSGEIAKAEADLRTQELLLAKAEAQVRSDLAIARSDLEAAQRLTGRMDARLLERARTARDLVDLQYRKGAATLLDTLDAQRTYSATASEALQDVAQYWGAVYRLEAAAGEELR